MRTYIGYIDAFPILDANGIKVSIHKTQRNVKPLGFCRNRYTFLSSLANQHFNDILFFVRSCERKSLHTKEIFRLKCVYFKILQLKKYDINKNNAVNAFLLKICALNLITFQ